MYRGHRRRVGISSVRGALGRPIGAARSGLRTGPRMAGTFVLAAHGRPIRREVVDVIEPIRTDSRRATSHPRSERAHLTPPVRWYVASVWSTPGGLGHVTGAKRIDPCGTWVRRRRYRLEAAATARALTRGLSVLAQCDGKRSRFRALATSHLCRPDAYASHRLRQAVWRFSSPPAQRHRGGGGHDCSVQSQQRPDRKRGSKPARP
jgi:hypothetical protein